MVVQSLACFHGRKPAIWQLSRNSCTGCHSAACSHSLCRGPSTDPGGLSKGRAAAANRQKLLQRPLGARALNRPGDYLPPARLACLVGVLWPDASQDNDSDIARLLHLGKEPHSGVWTKTPAQGLPLSLARLFDPRTLNQIYAGSSLLATVLAVLLIATTPENLECLSVPTPWRLQDWKARTDGALSSPTVRGCPCLLTKP